jgi:hypothetical protein
MGYRSDVQALIYPQSGDQNLLEYDKLKLLFGTTFKDVFEAWGEEYFSWDDARRVLIFDANSIKWYDSYPDVALFTPFLDEVHELGYEYEFMRIGEDDTDVELDDEGLEDVLVSWVHDPRYEEFGEEPEIDIGPEQQPTDELRYILLYDHWKAGTIKIREADRDFFPLYVRPTWWLLPEATLGHVEYGHPHPTISQDGRIVSFRSDRTGMSQMYLAHVSEEFRESVKAGVLDRPNDKWM